jgi:hypothetical protein
VNPEEAAWANVGGPTSNIEDRWKFTHCFLKILSSPCGCKVLWVVDPSFLMLSRSCHHL